MWSGGETLPNARLVDRSRKQALLTVLVLVPLVGQGRTGAPRCERLWLRTLVRCVERKLMWRPSLYVSMECESAASCIRSCRPSRWQPRSAVGVQRPDGQAVACRPSLRGRRSFHMQSRPRAPSPRPQVEAAGVLTALPAGPMVALRRALCSPCSPPSCTNMDGRHGHMADTATKAGGGPACTQGSPGDLAPR